jgi:DNA-binding Xre family transcriptional regulator
MKTRLKVKEIAESRGITMTKLSRISDVNYKTIHAIFTRPERDVEYKTLLKIAKALEVNVAELIEELPDRDW